MFILKYLFVQYACLFSEKLSHVTLSRNKHGAKVLHFFDIRKCSADFFVFFARYASLWSKKPEKPCRTNRKPPRRAVFLSSVAPSGRRLTAFVHWNNEIFIIHYSLFISFRVAHRTARRRSSSSTPAAWSCRRAGLSAPGRPPGR